MLSELSKTRPTRKFEAVETPTTEVAHKIHIERYNETIYDYLVLT
jgi:hypothetical protein